MTASEPLPAPLLRRVRRDPVFFCREVLGIEPWARQQEVLRLLRDHDRLAVRSGHGTGKSFIAASAVLWFLYAFHPAKVVTTAPTWAQVRAILWQEIRRQHARALLPLGGRVSDAALRLGPGAFAVGLSTDEPERFQGYHAEHLLVVLDEAPGVRPEVWEAAGTLVTSRMGRTLAIGNPVRASGPFFKCFEPGSGWATLRIACQDSPNLDGRSRFPALVTQAWIDSRRRAWGEDSPLYRSRVLGEFPRESDDRLLEREALRAACDAPPPPLDRSSLRLGVDVARHGSDATVFLLRDRHGVRSLEERRGWTTMQTAGRVIGLIREHALEPSAVAIDDTGLGAGVTDRLHEQGTPVLPVVLGAAGSDSSYFANCRAECFWRLREALLGVSEPGGPRTRFSLAGDEELAAELAGIRFELTSAGAIRIESKDALRARLGRSPDRADALALSFAPRAAERRPELTVVCA